MSFFPSKVLLFGEYTVVCGSAALAIPYHALRAELKFSQSELREEQAESNRLFGELIQDIKALKLDFSMDFEQMQSDFGCGIYLESNIPVGYGLGSSGALVAAIADRYSAVELNRSDPGSTKNIKALQQLFAQIESVFHGKSSGLDPLVSFLNQAMKIEEHQPIPIQPIEDEVLDCLFLVDSEQSRSTAPLVDLFKLKLEDSSYRTNLDHELVPQVEAAIDACISGDLEQLEAAFSKISQLQFNLFAEMITGSIRSVWLDGRKNNYWHLKLCGAGGGGFYLGFSRLSFGLLEQKFDDAGFSVRKLNISSR